MCNNNLILITLIISLGFSFSLAQTKTIVTINGENFYINNKITLKGVILEGTSLEGLLPNSRMVQGIFDDLNPDTRHLWKYPDTGEWNADRNTNEFIEAMYEWRMYGLLAFTLNIQGGSPTGYGNKGWVNPGFYKDGKIREDYFSRLEKILNKADELGMVVILGLFYFGQDEQLENEKAVVNAVNNTIDWLFEKNYRNILIEINNECNSKSYDHEILKAERVHELIELVKSKKHPNNGYRFYVSASYTGNQIPKSNVVSSADFILLHGNGVSNPSRITEMVKQSKEVQGFHPMPILFNEDDHFDFDKPVNNMINALKARASWGYFDFRKRGETLRQGDPTFNEGYQSIPVDWGINSKRKRDFFGFLAKISGIDLKLFCEDNSYVLVNAENVDNYNGWTIDSTMANGKSIKYLHWNGRDYFNSPGNQLIEYKIKIKNPGTYRFIWNSKVGIGNLKTEHNDSWLRIPDATDFYADKNGHILHPYGKCTIDCPKGAGSDGWFKVYSSGTTNWTWSTKTSDSDAHNIFAKFDKSGIYTVQISARSKGHFIAKFILYKESVYSEEEAKLLTDPNK